ncbi:DUF302 domain-containing protein [Photobacterium leiognathi]|uniref:DUF302 domain-containing protein n=1 Tax=Photobacterium leiognathi TaxID=553611 RepID=UPI002739C592|nr:DUF302 domain-containing protein [Photobacterium leiognathi]
MIKITFAIGIMMLSLPFSVSANDGLVRYESHYSVKETADRFESTAKDKGFTLFARVDHQKNAENVGLDLRPTEVIVFGSPKVGTLLMQCAQSSAIDLPQKVLISKDEDNKVWLSYNNPDYLMKRHSIQNCSAVVEKISSVLNGLAKATVGR